MTTRETGAAELVLSDWSSQIRQLVGATGVSTSQVEEVAEVFGAVLHALEDQGWLAEPLKFAALRRWHEEQQSTGSREQTLAVIAQLKEMVQARGELAEPEDVDRGPQQAWVWWVHCAQCRSAAPSASVTERLDGEYERAEDGHDAVARWKLEHLRRTGHADTKSVATRGSGFTPLFCTLSIDEAAQIAQGAAPATGTSDPLGSEASRA